MINEIRNVNLDMSPCLQPNWDVIAKKSLDTEFLLAGFPASSVSSESSVSSM